MGFLVKEWSCSSGSYTNEPETIAEEATELGAQRVVFQRKAYCDNHGEMRYWSITQAPPTASRK